MSQEPELRTEERLWHVLEELQHKEPLFHRLELATTRADFDLATAPGFWETGACGQRYSRQFVWAIFEARYAAGEDDPWQTSEFQCRQASPDTYCSLTPSPRANQSPAGSRCGAVASADGRLCITREDRWPCAGCSRERQARYEEPVPNSSRAMSRTAVAAQHPSVRQLSARRVLSRSRCRPRSPGVTQAARHINVFAGPRCGSDSCRPLYRLHAQLLLPQNRVRGLDILTEPRCGVAPAPAWPAA